jgi:hypothetical protein
LLKVVSFYSLFIVFEKVFTLPYICCFKGSIFRLRPLKFKFKTGRAVVRRKKSDCLKLNQDTEKPEESRYFWGYTNPFLPGHGPERKDSLQLFLKLRGED